MRIPRIIHQIWLGPSPLPEQDAAYVETWKRLHPDWEHRLWTEDDLAGETGRPETRERLRVPAERSDLLRLELVVRYGGVYVDTDFEALQPLDPLLEDVELFAAYLRDAFEDGSDQPAQINNAIFGAVPHHPVLVRALAEAAPRTTYGYDKSAVGPKFLDRMLQGTDATFFDRRLFYPRQHERAGAVAFHHQARSWKDVDGLRRSLAVARRRRSTLRLEVRELETRRRLREQPSPARRAQWELFRAEKLARRVDRKLRWEGGRAREAARRRVRPAAELARARLAGAVPQSAPGTVPERLHVIWLDGEPPAHVLRRAAAWRLANPGWTVRLWTEADLPADWARPQVAERLRAPAERADLLRLDILRHEGGVVVSPELAARRLGPLVGGAACFGAEAGGRPSTALVGARPGDPAIEAAIAEQRPRTWSGYDADATGAGALARAREAGAGIVLLGRLGATGLDETTDRAALRDEVLAVEAELASLEEGAAALRRSTSG